MPNKKRRCANCKKYGLVEEMIRPNNLNAFCNFTCAAEYGQKKAIDKREKEKRKKHKELRESIKTKGDLKKEAQIAVNKFIRIRDSKRPCISCGEYKVQKRGGTMDAGHYRSVGSSEHLRFYLFNINGQCTHCNNFLSGNIVEYRKGLIKKYGLEMVERIELDHRGRNYTKDDFRRIKKIFTKRANLYQKRFR